MNLFVERRRPGLAPDLLLRVGLAWAMIAALLLVANIRDIMAVRLSAAEVLAAVAVPLLALGCVLLLAGRIGWRLVGEEASGFACVAMALSVPVIGELQPLRMEAGGWQVVLWLAALNGLMARDPRSGGRVTGAALAGSLAISLDALPFAAAVCGVLALRWLRHRQDAAWLTATLQSLAVSAALLFAATLGVGGAGWHCGGLSPAHLALFGCAAVLATGLAALEPLPRAAVVAGLAAALGVGAAAYLAFAPHCAAASPGTLPLWRQGPGLALQIVVPPLVGLYACLQLAGRSADWLRRWWLEYAALLAFALALAVFDGRGAGLAGAMAAVPLGWRIREWIRSARTSRRAGRRVAALATIAIALLPALPLNLLTFALPAEAAAAR
jgi:hypothetical protein